MVDKITSPVGVNDVIKKINDAIDAIPTSTTQLTNDSGYVTGITSSMVTTALGFTPYSNANPSGYQANVIETIKVNNTAQTVTSKTVNITVPAAVTETTVSGWGFTKNAGTVTKVNNVSPDANGNVTIPTGGTVDQTFNASSTNAQSGTAIAGAGFITGITSSMVTSALGYTPYNSTNPSGYQANVIETIKVNGTAQTPSSKTVSLTVPTTTTAVTSGSTAALTSGGAYTNLLRLSGAQTVSGNKTFSGTVVLGANASATTPATSSNTTAVATTAFVKAQGYLTSISSSDVTTALGFTPYSNANPSGYQANVLETVKVNGTALTPSSKTVDVTVPTTTTAVTSGSSAALTSGGAYSNLVRLTGAQTITGNKTFSGTVALGSSATATTPDASSNTTAVATTAFVKAQGYITSASVSSLTDTNISGVTNGQALVYDSSTDKWKNANVSVNVSYDSTTSTLYIG